MSLDSSIESESLERKSGVAGMWGPAVNAVKHHWAPLLFIQVCAVVLVIVYQHDLSLRSALAIVETVKARGGVPFAFLVGGLAGGVIPEIAKLVTGRLRSIDREWISRAGFNAFVYGVVGVEVDVFYQCQSHWFGNGRDFATLATKTSVDMFAFSPSVAILTAVLLYAWRAEGFRFPTGNLRTFGAFYADRVLPTLILAWIFWIPVLFCVYSLPANLQFPFSNLAEAAWSMVFVFFTTDGGS